MVPHSRNLHDQLNFKLPHIMSYQFLHSSILQQLIHSQLLNVYLQVCFRFMPILCNECHSFKFINNI